MQALSLLSTKDWKNTFSTTGGNTSRHRRYASIAPFDRRTCHRRKSIGILGISLDGRLDNATEAQKAGAISVIVEIMQAPVSSVPLATNKDLHSISMTLLWSYIDVLHDHDQSASSAILNNHLFWRHFIHFGFHATVP